MAALASRWPTVFTSAFVPAAREACVDASDWFVRPCDVVAIALVASYRHNANWSPLHLIAPVERGGRSYLNRIGLVDHLEKLGADVSGFDDVRGNSRNLSSDFTEIVIGKDGDHVSAKHVLRRFIFRQFESDLTNRLYDPIATLIANVQDHATLGKGAAISASQVQVYPDRIELAVGDTGPGFMRTLKRSTRYTGVARDMEALRLAASEGATRRGEGTDHGGDFQRMIRSVKQHGGQVHVQSHHGRLALKRQRIRYYHDDMPFPGVIVTVELPIVGVQQPAP